MGLVQKVLTVSVSQNNQAWSESQHDGAFATYFRVNHTSEHEMWGSAFNLIL